MKHILYFFICITAILTGCSRKDSATDNTKLVHDQLHGKYKIVSSVSNDAVDINLDGTASTNIFSELPTLAQAYRNLEIRIIDKDKFLIDEPWPQQDFGSVVPLTYDSSLVVNYVNQGIVRFFSMEGNDILMKPDTEPVPDLVRFPFPTSVTMVRPSVVKIVVDRKFYTSKGWVTTTVTTFYMRYTMET